MSSPSTEPLVVVLMGPNGAGKSTLAPDLLRDMLGVTQYVNADTIAQGLSGFDPLGAALEAGRIMLHRLHELGKLRVNFAFETTGASRSLSPWLKQLKANGWYVHISYLWLPDPQMAIERVASRTKAGGHWVPEHLIQRRYALGLANFWNLYRPIASTWRVYDNATAFAPDLIARGEATRVESLDPEKWARFRKMVSNG